MKGLYLIGLLLLGASPQAKAQVSPAVHKMCASVADYKGCVEANSQKTPKKTSDKTNAEDAIPESVRDCIEKTLIDNRSKHPSAEKNSDAVLKVCLAADSLSKSVNTPDRRELKRGLKDFTGVAFDHYLWHQKNGESVEIDTSIKFSACMQGFAKSKNFLMPASFMREWRYLPDEYWDKWLNACLWYTNPYVYSSGGLNFVYDPSDKSKQIAFDFVGARRIILGGRRDKYVRFTGSDTVLHSGYTIPGQRGYVDCAWGGSHGGSWDYYTGSNSGYCIAEEGTKDIVVPPSIRNQMWEFTVDCIDKTFDRNKDTVNWRSVQDSWTARKGFDVLCPLIDELPVEVKS